MSNAETGGALGTLITSRMFTHAASTVELTVRTACHGCFTTPLNAAALFVHGCPPKRLIHCSRLRSHRIDIFHNLDAVLRKPDRVVLIHAICHRDMYLNMRLWLKLWSLLLLL